MACVKRGMDKTKLRPLQELYIAFDGYDLSFYPSEVEQVGLMWRRGVGIDTIAEQLVREQEEIAILIMDLALQDLVGARPGGMCGHEVLAVVGKGRG